MNNNYYRPFKTFDEQINILKSRGLIINDIENAKIILSTSTYYELINGYQNWFTTSKDKYMPEISIEFLNEFYYFDHGFQNILFLHSVYVETSFKVCLSYVLAGKYGEHQKDYLNRNIYVKPRKQNDKKIFNDTFNSINYLLTSELHRVDNPTKHYREKNHIPPWILLKNVNFSNSINLYRFLKTEDKLEVIKLMIPDISNNVDFNDNSDVEQLLSLFISSINIVRKFRNKIAHNLKFISYTSGNYKLKNKILKDLPISVFFDKNEYNNSYSMIISLILLSKDKLTQGKLIQSITSYLENPSFQPLINKYFSITGIPNNIIDKFKNYIDLFN